MTLEAPDVTSLCDELSLSDEARAEAQSLVERVFWDYPINKSPSVMAASCVYFAALKHNEKRTLEEVSEASGITEISIQRCHSEIKDHELEDADDGEQAVSKEQMLEYYRISKMLESPRGGEVGTGWVCECDGGGETDSKELNPEKRAKVRKFRRLSALAQTRHGGVKVQEGVEGESILLDKLQGESA